MFFYKTVLAFWLKHFGEFRYLSKESEKASQALISIVLNITYFLPINVITCQQYTIYLLHCHLVWLTTYQFLQTFERNRLTHLHRLVFMPYVLRLEIIQKWFNLVLVYSFCRKICFWQEKWPTYWHLPIASRLLCKRWVVPMVYSDYMLTVSSKRYHSLKNMFRSILISLKVTFFNIWNVILNSTPLNWNIYLHCVHILKLINLGVVIAVLLL